MNEENQTTVTDEQVDEQITELSKKEDRTEEDNKKIEELKGEKQTRFQKRIDTLTYRSKSAEEKAEKLERELADVRASQQQVESTPKQVEVVKKTTEIDGQAYYTDTTLRQMIDANQISESEAYTHQQERNSAKAADDAYKKIKKEQVKEQTEKQKQSELLDVLKEYPEWDPKNPSHNPKDELMVEVTDLYNAGVPIKKALEKAKRIVGIKTPIDNTDNVSLRGPAAPSDKTKKQAVTFTEEQEDMAHRMWRDKKNPATGRLYTRTEAVEKAKNALAKRRQ